MIYIIDTYAWVEYFRGSRQGLILSKLFSNTKNKFITLECCLAELKGYCLKHSVNYTRMQDIVKRNSIILPILTDLWIKAAEIKFELRKGIQHFGLIDALLVAKQREIRCKIISGDPHFKTLKQIVYLGT